HFLRLRRRLQLEGALIDRLSDGCRVLAIRDDQLHCLADLVGELLARKLRCRRQPGALNGVRVLPVAATGGQRKRQHQREEDGFEQHRNLWKEPSPHLCFTSTHLPPFAESRIASSTSCVW